MAYQDQVSILAMPGDRTTATRAAVWARSQKGTSSFFSRRCDDEMVHIDCCCFRAVYDEWCGRSRTQAVRLLCPRPDPLLQTSEGQMLQGAPRQVLQVTLQQRLWKQPLRQQRQWQQLCSQLCCSGCRLRSRCRPQLCRSGCRLRSGRCSQLCCSRCLRSGRCPQLCRSGCLQQRLQLGLPQPWLQQRLQLGLPQAQVLQGSSRQVLQGTPRQVLQGSPRSLLQEPLQQRLRQQQLRLCCPHLCSSRELCRSGQLCRSGCGCLVQRDCHRVMATAT